MRRWLILGLLVAGNSARAAPAGVAAQLELGRDLYFEGKYEAALPILAAVAHDEEALAATRLESRSYQALTLYLLERREEARSVWLTILEQHPDYRLDPVEVSPDLIRFFAAIEPPTEARLAEPSLRTADATGPVPGSSEQLGAPSLDGPQRGCGVLLCLVPFGIGQLANGRTGKGALFALSELAFLGANMGFYWSRRVEIDRYGKPRDQAAADRSFVLQHIFLVLFATTALGGVIDAFVFP